MAILAGVGIILGLLVSFFVIDIWGLTPDNSGAGLRLGIMISLAIVGIIVGLIFEKSTRARYLAAMGKNPAVPEFKERVERAYGRGSKFGWIIGGIYLLLNIWSVYRLFALGVVLSPAAHLQLILEVIFDGIVALISLWLFFERWENSSTPNAKKMFLFTAIFFTAAALISGATLFTLKTTTQTLSNTQIGRGDVISLGASSTPLGNISVVLPVGFQIQNVGSNQVVMQPANSSSQAIGSSVMTVAVVSADPAMAVSNVESNLRGLGYYTTRSTTTFLGYEALKVAATLRGGQPTNNVVFEANNSTFVVGATEAADPIDLSGHAIISSLDDIVASMRIEGGPSSSVSGRGIITLSTTTLSVTLSLGDNASTTFSMMVPPEYKISGQGIITESFKNPPSIFFYSESTTTSANGDVMQTLINSVNNWSSEDNSLPVNVTSTIFLGYPAHIITAQNDRAAKTIVFQVGNEPKLAEINIIYASPDATFENSQLDAMVNSIRVSQ